MPCMSSMQVTAFVIYVQASQAQVQLLSGLILLPSHSVPLRCKLGSAHKVVVFGCCSPS